MSHESTPRPTPEPETTAGPAHGEPYWFSLDDHGSVQTAESFQGEHVKIELEASPYMCAEGFPQIGNLPARGDRKILFLSENGSVLYLRGNKLYGQKDLAKGLLDPIEITEDDPLLEVTTGKKGHPRYLFGGKERVKEVLVAGKQIPGTSSKAAKWRDKVPGGRSSRFAEFDHAIDELANNPSSAFLQPDTHVALNPEELLEKERADLRESSDLGPAPIFEPDDYLMWSPDTVTQMDIGGRIVPFQYNPDKPGSPWDQMERAGAHLTPRRRKQYEIRSQQGDEATKAAARAKLAADGKVVGVPLINSRHEVPISPQPPVKAVTDADGEVVGYKRQDPYKPRRGEAINLALRDRTNEAKAVGSAALRGTGTVSKESLRRTGKGARIIGKTALDGTTKAGKEVYEKSRPHVAKAARRGSYLARNADLIALDTIKEAANTGKYVKDLSRWMIRDVAPYLIRRAIKHGVKQAMKELKETLKKPPEADPSIQPDTDPPADS